MDLSLKLCLLEIARPHLCLVALKWVNNRALLKQSIAYVSAPVSTQYLSSTRYTSLLHPSARGETSRNPNSFKKTGLLSAISQKRRPMTQVALVTNGLQFHQKVKLRLLVNTSMPSLRGANLLEARYVFYPRWIHTVIGRPFSVPNVHKKAPEVQMRLLPAQKNQVRRSLSMQ